MPAPTACLECRERHAYRRGVCRRCYDRMARRVRGGEETWPQLEQAGRILPVAVHPWRKRQAPKEK